MSHSLELVTSHRVQGRYSERFWLRKLTCNMFSISTRWAEERLLVSFDRLRRNRSWFIQKQVCLSLDTFTFFLMNFEIQLPRYLDNSLFGSIAYAFYTNTKKGAGISIWSISQICLFAMIIDSRTSAFLRRRTCREHIDMISCLEISKCHCSP